MKPLILIITLLITSSWSPEQERPQVFILKKYTAVADFLDACIHSLNSLNSLIRKDNYRNKITSFNNPASSELGFNLQTQIQTALEPLLRKTRKTNQGKFTEMVQSLVSTAQKQGTIRPILNHSAVFSSIVGLVANLAITEKGITREDIDQFIITTGRYFQQYEKLNTANQTLETGIEKLIYKIRELNDDIHDYMCDLNAILYPTIKKEVYKKMNTEELFLKYLDRPRLETVFHSLKTQGMRDSVQIEKQEIYFPGDGIKTAKEISSGIQKLFREYEMLYAGNFREIQSIVSESRSLGPGVDIKTVEKSIAELEILYNESKKADAENLRFQTLVDRLQSLVKTEQLSAKG